jgi:type III secretory pathway component EscS
MDPSSGNDNLYLIEITYNGSNVLIKCVVGVWRQNVGKLQKQTADCMLKLGVVSEHNMCCEHTRGNSF